MFRHPDTTGKSPRLSKTKAKALRRKDRFPKLPLAITLRETYVAMRLHLGELAALAWLTFLVYAGASFVFALLSQWISAQGDQNFALSLAQSHILGFVRAGLLEFLLLGFYSIAVFRLMLLGEPPQTPRYTDLWLRRFLVFLAATLRAMVIPLLAFIPLILFVGAQIWWFSGGAFPSFIPKFLYLQVWPTGLLKILGALGFYILFARYAFVQPATAVDVPYSARESWRVTNWVWVHMMTITLATLGPAVILIGLSQALIGDGGGLMGFVGLLVSSLLACLFWLIGLTAFVVALSIAFCLRTGWRPGAQKLALNTRPTRRPLGT